MKLSLAVILSLWVLCAGLPERVLRPEIAAAQSQQLWIDQSPLPSWNTPGMDLPPAPQLSERSDPICGDPGKKIVRDPETPEDLAVASAGWKLFGEYRGGWGVRIVHGFVGHDTFNCHPRIYQSFVFVNGTFVGTLSPQPSLYKQEGMELESETVLFIANSGFADAVRASFGRYGGSDMACCPSSATTVTYRIDWAGPVLVPERAFTGALRS